VVEFPSFPFAEFLGLQIYLEERTSKVNRVECAQMVPSRIGGTFDRIWTVFIGLELGLGFVFQDYTVPVPSFLR